MRNMIIGGDLDNTMCAYTTGLSDFIAEDLGVTDMAAHALAYGPPVDYSMSNWPGFPTAFTDFHTRAVEAGLYLKLKVFEGASEKLWKLSDSGLVDIRIITSRFVKNGQNSTVVRDTGIWLDANKIPYRDIMFTATKVDIFADVYIDDSPSNITKLRAAGRKVIVFDAPYNQDFDGLRVKNWEEAHVMLHDMAVKFHRKQVALDFLKSINPLRKAVNAVRKSKVVTD